MRLTRAEINLQALRYNVHAVRSHIPSTVKIMGLVKANGYGHGLTEIASAFVDYGIDYLGVGFLEEGIALREKGISCPVLVLGGVFGSQVKEFLHYNLEMTVSSMEIAHRIEETARQSNGIKARAHLKIDTGMERIGVQAERALPFIEQVMKLRNVDVVGLYSHFATSDERDKSFAREQLVRFRSVLDQMKQRSMTIPLIHIGNSGAVLDLPDSYFGMVRPGVMLYGIYPSKETTQSIPLKPVLSLKSNVVFIKDVESGVSISYGRTYTTKSKTRIATIPIGYGDGYSRRLTNKGEVIIHGKRYPVVGTVCMDQLMVDIGVQSNVHVGDDVVLIGTEGTETISTWDVADKLGTIPYEIVTGIAERVPRVYIQ